MIVDFSEKRFLLLYNLGSLLLTSRLGLILW